MAADFNPYLTRAKGLESQKQDAGAKTEDTEIGEDERLDAPRLLVLPDSFVGVGISWTRTVCFRIEVQIRLPFFLVSVGIGRPAIVKLSASAPSEKSAQEEAENE